MIAPTRDQRSRRFCISGICRTIFTSISRVPQFSILRTGRETSVVHPPKAKTPETLRSLALPGCLIAHQIKHHPARPDDESSIAAVRFRLPAKPSVPFPISFGSRISGQAADVIPDFDFPLHLLLDRRCFCCRPSVTAPSTEAVDAVPALGGLCTFCQAFVPAPVFLRLFRPRS